MTKGFPIVAAGFLALAACSPTPPTVASGTDAPVAGAASARPTPSAEPANANVAPTAVLNSDNRPVAIRSGLNSDPNNPSGAPGGSRTY
jgi:hypothetical protein